MTRIAHLSDVHFGRIAYPEIVAALVDDVNALEVDLVVLSGDLTQRARPRQFKDALAMLEGFKASVLVVPGNHDVNAWWHRPLTRVFRPLRRYQRYVEKNLAPTFEHEDVAVLGINSAYGVTIKGGWIRSQARARIVEYFAEQGAGAFKILVVHHHLKRLAALGQHDVSRRAQQTLEAVAEARVDLVLCGHLHVSHVQPVMVGPGEHQLVIAAAGTATSNRWRAPHLGINAYNLIAIAPAGFTVEERRYDPEAQAFAPARETSFAR